MIIRINLSYSNNLIYSNNSKIIRIIRLSKIYEYYLFCQTYYLDNGGLIYQPNISASTSYISYDSYEW